MELITWLTPILVLGSSLFSSSNSSTLVALVCWGLFLEVLEEKGVGQVGHALDMCSLLLHLKHLPFFIMVVFSSLVSVVRLKLAFCITCVGHVLVLAQGPSFRDSGGPG